MPDSLLVITNRKFRQNRGDDSYTLLDEPNSKGPKELRLFWAKPTDTGLENWHLDIVPDRPNSRTFEAESVEPACRKRKYNGSDLAASIVVDRLQRHKQNLLLFIHGYNNNALNAFRRAWRVAQRYNVQVIVFTWPANGGGRRVLEDLHGVLSYKLDKSDARASTEALDRALGRMQLLMKERNESVWPAAHEEAEKAHPDDPERRREMLVRLLKERACPFNTTLLAHSMGNYLYKKMLLTSSQRLSKDMVFDNVILKAADTNHEAHAVWVERIRARRRVYITINEEDDALRLSTMKFGDQQGPRLGNTLFLQNAPNATYIDFTGYVGDAHSYFTEKDIGKRRGQAAPLTDFFGEALNGRVAESGLTYRADTNVYRLV